MKLEVNDYVLYTDIDYGLSFFALGKVKKFSNTEIIVDDIWVETDDPEVETSDDYTIDYNDDYKETLIHNFGGELLTFEEIKELHPELFV